MDSLKFQDVDPSKKKEVASVYFDQVGRVKETPVFLLGDVSFCFYFSLRTSSTCYLVFADRPFFLSSTSGRGSLDLRC